MDGKKLKRTAVLAVFMALIALSTLLTATYAWFTSANARVNTSKVTGKTSGSEVKLLLSETADFTNADSSVELQNAGTDTTILLPVSSDDLQNFVTGVAVGEANAKSFALVENESDYLFHKQIFIKAESNAQDLESMALYFEDVSPLESPDAGLLSAGRLGLAFQKTGSQDRTVTILTFREDNDRQVGNTMLLDSVLGAGQILRFNPNAPGSVEPVDEDAALWEAYAVGSDGIRPEKPLCVLELNTVYSMDVYFYLQGCDPDCVNAIRMSPADLQLRFYGVPA